MRKKSICQIKRETKCIRSLVQSILKASGSVRAFSPENLKQMTAWEFVSALAPNNIEFVYKKPTEDKGGKQIKFVYKKPTEDKDVKRTKMEKAISKLVPENESISQKDLHTLVCKELKIKRGNITNKLEFLETLRKLKTEGFFVDVTY